MRAPTYAVLALVAAISATPAHAQITGALGGGGAREAGRHMAGPAAGRLFATGAPASTVDAAAQYLTMTGENAYGLAVRYLGNSLLQPLFSASLSNASSSGVSHNLAQLGVSITSPTFYGNRMSVTGGANYRHTSNVSNSAGFFEELDYVVSPNDASTKITVAQLLMWEHDQLVRTIAANAGLAPGLMVAAAQQTWELAGEYDFKTNYTGENSYLVTGAYIFGGSRWRPALIASYQKHDVVTLGLRLKLR